ncbi:MAG: TonB-dependent receptor plug domain-containing protein [Agriterribacter sp.]
MSGIRKGILFLFGICLSVATAFSQDKAEQALQQFEQSYPQEKIYMLFTKDSYVAGETMFFKAVVFEGYNRSAISSSLFVELYNSSKNQVSRRIVPLFDGEGNGSFVLPDSLKEGAYYVRAYTQWMLNFDESFQYLQPIVVNNPSSPQKLVVDSTSAWTAAAFPEGGTFIEGAVNKVAIRLSSPGTLPADWSGFVVDAAKPAEKIATFNSLDRNVGLFTITPQKGKQYQVIVQDKKGKKQTVKLPEVATSGVNLQVNSTPEAVIYSLKFINLPSGSKGYKIIGTINNTLVYKASINKAAPEISSSIPTEKLINGILQITIFDEQEKVAAQRLCFIQPETIKVGRPSFPPLYLSKSARGLNAFDIAPDTSYLSYTILVRDGATEDELEKNNILTTMYLTGDFPGKIDAPATYLGYDANTAGLDALLISEKWKRFDWASIMAGKFPEIKYQPQPYISYKGKVTTNGGQAAANSTVNLIFYFQDSTNQIHQVQTDANGVFVLNNLIFDEPIKVYYQLNNEKKGAIARQTNVIFEPLYMFAPLKGNLPPSGYTLVKRPANDVLPRDVARGITTRDNQHAANEKFKTLEEVKITAQKKSNKEKLNEQLSSGMFRSMNENVFDFVNENQEAQSYTNILQWLQGRVAGLQIQMQNGNYVPIIRGSQVGIYLNEMPADASQISSLPVADIAMVKVIKGPFVGGVGGGGGGAVAIYTKRGDTQPAAASKQPPALNNATINGYDKVATFYAPDYNETGTKSVDKDTRDVLYWNPVTIAERNKSVTVKWFNNDDAQNFRVIIIGFSKDDDTPLYYNDIFKVRNKE